MIEEQALTLEDGHSDARIERNHNLVIAALALGHIEARDMKSTSNLAPADRARS